MKVSLFLVLMFVISNQPMFMIGMLMMLVILYSLNIYFEIMSFWFGYILMLVLLSGVLVVFSYVISLIPNESFEISSLVMFLFILLYFFLEKYSLAVSMDESFTCMLLWEGLILGYTMYLVGFLLMVMIMVIFLSYPQVGALRLFLSAW